MSKPPNAQLVRALVDFYQGGQLLYKKDNLYPSNEQLQLLLARGDAQAYEPTQAKPNKAAGKSGKAVDSAAPADSSVLSVTGSTADIEAAKALADAPLDASASKDVEKPAQGSIDEVADSKDQPVRD